MAEICPDLTRTAARGMDITLLLILILQNHCVEECTGSGAHRERCFHLLCFFICTLQKTPKKTTHSKHTVSQRNDHKPNKA